MSDKKGNGLERFTPVLLVASILLAFGVGVLWQKVQNLEKGVSTPSVGNQAAPSAPTNLSGKLSEDQAKKLPEITKDDHIKGSGNAQVYLVEYSDLQCPYCKQFHPTAQRVLEEYGDKVAWIYRHFPLSQIHPQATPAAEASECIADIAGNDAFWEFTDLVFETQTYLNDLPGAAAKIGVNAGAFKSCFDSGKFKDKVQNQYQAGITAGVTGTPANFIVNSKGEVWLVPGALPFDQLKATIDEALSS